MASDKTSILILKHVDLLKIFQVNSYFIKSTQNKVFQVSMTIFIKQYVDRVSNLNIGRSITISERKCI